MRVMKIESNLGSDAKNLPKGQISVMVMPEAGDRLDTCFYCRHFHLECRNPRSEKYGDVTGFLDTCRWWELRPWSLSKDGHVVMEAGE